MKRTEKRWATVDKDGILLWVSEKGESRTNFDNLSNPMGKRIVRVTLTYEVPDEGQ